MRARSATISVLVAVAAGVTALVLSFAACSSSSESEPPVEAVCTPAQSQGCVAPSGCSGRQTCNAAGTGFEPCACSPAGDGGVGGGDGASSLDATGGGDASREGGGDGGCAATAVCAAIPARASFDRCGACDQCAAASCCTQVTACFTIGNDGGSGDCSQLLDCYASCRAIDAGTACANACSLSYPDALTRGQAARTCLQTSCSTPCAASL